MVAGRNSIAAAIHERATAMFVKAMGRNLELIRREVAASSVGTDPTCLDLGSWNGENVDKYVPEPFMRFGAEIDRDAAAIALSTRSINSVVCDLSSYLPFRDESFDVVTSNQVIEHLFDTDSFVSEVFRVLRPGGRAVISTENAASWHNVASLLFGWQPFSLTNVSREAAGLGNPFAVYRGVDEPGAVAWQHMRIFAYRGLKELFEAHRFHDVAVRGSGYYPLPAAIAAVDPRHAALIIAVATKPNAPYDHGQNNRMQASALPDRSERRNSDDTHVIPRKP